MIRSDDPAAPEPWAIDRHWMELGTAALGTAAVLALVVVALKLSSVWGPAVAPDLMARALVMHVNLSALVWCIASGCAAWCASATGLQRVAARLGWMFAVAGTAAMALIAATGAGRPVMSNFVPVIDSPVFLAGLACLALGAVMVTVPAILRARRAAPNAVYRFALMPAALASVSFAISFAAVPDAPPRHYFEWLFWGPGHLLQFTYCLLMMAAWTQLARAAGAGIDVDSKAVRACFVAAAAPAVCALLIHAVYPPHSAEFRAEFTRLMALASWPGAAALAALLLGRRVLRNGPRWSSPASVSLAVSMVLFFSGLMLGAISQPDTLSIPAHYHGTLAAITVAWMGISGMSADAGSPSAAVVRLRRLQLWCYGGGTAVFMAGLYGSGAAKAIRKAPFAGDEPAFCLVLLAAGAVVAIGATVLFVALQWRVPFARSCARAGSAASRVDWRPRRVADVRPRAMLLAGIGILALGTFVIWLPGPSLQRDASRPGAESVDARAATMREAREVHQRFHQGAAMLHARQYEHALAAFHRVLELDPAMPEANVNMGYALVGLGNHAAARDFFETAINLRPGQVNAYYGLAIALEGMQDLPGAIGAMRTYVHLARPEDPHRRKAEAALWEWRQVRVSRVPVSKTGSENIPAAGNSSAATPAR